MTWVHIRSTCSARCLWICCISNPWVTPAIMNMITGNTYHTPSMAEWLISIFCVCPIIVTCVDNQWRVKRREWILELSQFSSPLEQQGQRSYLHESCREWRANHKTRTSEISRRTIVRLEMSGPVGVRLTTRRNVGNTSPENDAWSKQ